MTILKGTVQGFSLFPLEMIENGDDLFPYQNKSTFFHSNNIINKYFCIRSKYEKILPQNPLNCFTDRNTVMSGYCDYEVFPKMVLKFVILLQLHKYNVNTHRHEVPPTMRHWSFRLCIDQKGTCTLY